MFRHKSNTVAEKDEGNANLENENDDSIHDEETFLDDLAEQEDEKIEECENENTMNRTFSNPSQDTNEKKFKCENCDFGANTKSDLNNHKTSIHNWCPTCFSSFVTKERLILHQRKKHSKL